jgi:FkbM family methyltransferase
LTRGPALLVRARRILNYARAFGRLRGPYLLAKLRFARQELVQLSLPAFGAPILVRPRTSDKTAFEQVFVFRDYDTSFLNFTPEVIVDGGANAGFATRWFAHIYPSARIFAIEPEASNFELLVRNTSHLDTVVPIRAALWNRATSLTIDNPMDEKWAFRVAEKSSVGATEVQAITMEEVVASTPSNRVDILKLDIEGAEREVFEADCGSWLGRVKAIIIELHDRLRPGCAASFYRAIRPYKFTEFQRGEHVIAVRRDF